MSCRSFNTAYLNDIADKWIVSRENDSSICFTLIKDDIARNVTITNEYLQTEIEYSGLGCSSAITFTISDFENILKNLIRPPKSNCCVYREHNDSVECDCEPHNKGDWFIYVDDDDSNRILVSHRSHFLSFDIPLELKHVKMYTKDTVCQ